MKLKCPINVFLIMGALLLSSDLAANAKQVTDLLGRNVRLPDDPLRVIALAPNITEIIYAIKQEHRLKGVTQYSNFPAEAQRLPKVGSYVHLDLERIVALKPDLCIATKDGNPRVAVDRLEAMGIPVYAVDPRNLDTVMRTIHEIGNVFNANNEAQRLTRSMQVRIERVKAMVLKSTDRPGVFFQIGISPIVSVGTHTFIHELIELAGGKNLAQGSTPYPRFSREQVLSLAPEIIIITSMARAAVFERIKAEWSRWPDMPAVRNQKIFVENSDLFDRPSPRLVDALELLAERIHPELFLGNK